MKKQFITEAARLQKLAGIITESVINDVNANIVAKNYTIGSSALESVINKFYPMIASTNIERKIDLGFSIENVKESIERVVRIPEITGRTLNGTKHSSIPITQ